MKTIIILLLLSLPLRATTYYVCAATGSPCNASDANAGTSQSATWLHAPGMSTATGLASSTTINAGDSIILRGGDTWHFGNSGSLPFAGFLNHAWIFARSGTSTSCQLNPAAGAILTGTCIYIGVDKTWFNASTCGASWCRPMMNMDNPITTSSPASCSFEDSSFNLIDFSGSFLVIDNLEILGYCNNVTTPFNSVVRISTQDEMKNSYWHGWTMGTTATGCGTCDSDEYWAINSPNIISSWNSRIDHNVFDGSDSTFGNLSVAVGNATGAAFLGGGEVDHNVLNHLSNGVKFTYVWIFHDNFIENMASPCCSGTHGNIFEMPGTANNWTIDTYYYNNVIRLTVEGETVDFYPGTAASGLHGYIFNNVMTGANGNSGNCYMIEGDGTGGPGTTFFFNNTSDSPCSMRPLRGTSTGIFQNNHFIGYSPSGAIGNFSSMSVSTDNGNELWQTEAIANGQGYTNANNYAPTLIGNPTVSAGTNLASICAGMDNAEAQTACSSGISGVTYNAGNHTAVDNATNVRPASASWDIGAYQFSSTVVTPAPALGMFADLGIN